MIIEYCLIANTFITITSFNDGNCDFSTMILNIIKEGKIVPSEVTVKLIQKEMDSSDSLKFLIDGFPRSEENRIAFEHVVSFSLYCLVMKMVK